MDLIKKQAEANRLYGAICASPAIALEPHGLLKVSFEINNRSY
jgi:protein deglycase